MYLEKLLSTSTIENQTFDRLSKKIKHITLIAIVTTILAYILKKHNNRKIT